MTTTICSPAVTRLPSGACSSAPSRLSSDARADMRPGDDRHEVRVWWAAPVDRLDRPGSFWAFFPTATASLVPGILNAPWKTNNVWQNLLTGPYNDELIAASASLIAESLPLIPTAEDPARHLDVLPRRHEAGDSQPGRPAPRAAVHGASRASNRSRSERGTPPGWRHLLPADAADAGSWHGSWRRSRDGRPTRGGRAAGCTTRRSLGPGSRPSTACPKCTRPTGLEGHASAPGFDRYVARSPRPECSHRAKPWRHRGRRSRPPR